ncbi:receptor-like protein kinase isoform X1 [Zingiber officinale]|uniref:receptor-like protein kinase isoform X1 n=1 Tax=Zingiber officinale TaxID=94328 RepID=UPI001C4DD06B|nr:receptor-like protein kinase isoform X1 [Zingiber officinale]
MISFYGSFGFSLGLKRGFYFSYAFSVLKGNVDTIMVLGLQPMLLLLLLAFFQLSNALNSDGKVLLALSGNLILPRLVNSTWNSSDPSPCGWAGIGCDRGGFVTSFELPELQISGSLGKEIGLLSHLRKLDLGVNDLSGLIPSELGNCTLLEYLDLSDNYLSGEIPETLQNLKKLSYLSLFTNLLSSNIPSLLFRSPSLETIYLSDNNLNGSVPSFDENTCKVKFLKLNENNLSGILPTSIGNCSKLEELYLNKNQLTGLIPRTINDLIAVDVSENDLVGNIPFTSKTCKLENLVMSFNQFDGEIPTALGNCSNLKNLAIVHNHLSGRIPSTLGLLTKLEILYLSINSLSGSIPSEIGQCQSLISLQLYKNQLEGIVPRELGNLKNLESLLLFSNNLTGELPIEIWRILNLTTVLIYDNNFSGQLPVEMCQLKSLSNISIYDNQFTGVIPQCLGINSSLVQVDFTNSGLVGNIPPNICFRNQLISMTLGNNKLNGTIPIGVGNCLSLQRLILSHNNLSGSIPEFFVASSLSYVDLSFNKLSGQIPQTVGNIVNLTDVNLSMNKLNGPIPRQIGNLANLERLNLSNNNLYGPLPFELSECRMLFSLDLGFNSFNGTIPASLGNLSSLSQLILQENQFSEGIPNFLAELNGLIELQFGGNKLGGSIQPSLGSLQNLKVALNLSDNGLVGQLPLELRNLNMLQSFDISFNNLTGGLMPLSDLSSLTYINISYNNFSGSLPRGLLKFVESSPSSFIGNPQLCISCQTEDSTCSNITILEQCSVPNNNSKGVSKIVIVIIALASGLLCALVLFLARFFFLRCKRKKDDVPSLHEDSSFLLKKVIEATEDFNQQYEIGRGAHGIVYKAVLDIGKIYAVKKIVFPHQKRSNQSMIREIQTLGKIRHRNLVKLEKFWFECGYGLILYEYMAKGSLHDVLHEIKPTPVLEWKVRYKIALGIAQGLDYLHNDCSPAIIHHDIKPKNILLDANMEPHISDFGIAKLDQDSTQSATIMGTLGYIAPETAYTTRRSKELDVYSYGVVLLELITRKMAIDPSFSENMDIVGWVTSSLDGSGKIEAVMDEDLTNEVTGSSEIKEVNKVLSLTMRCVAREASRRPSMRNVVRELLDI